MYFKYCQPGSTKMKDEFIVTAPIILRKFGSRKMMQMASVGCVLSWLAGSQMKNLISIQIILGFIHSYFMNSFFFCSNVVYQS